MIVSVPDPNPHVFGPPGSGSISQKYGTGSGSGSGSFYQQAKLGRKTWIPTVTSFGLFIFKNHVNVLSKSNKQKNFFFKLVFCSHHAGQ